MATDADKYVYENSIEPQENVNLFESKKWTYITDSSSQNGLFNGQIQFDLNTLSSQSSWVDLSSAVVTFPVKLKITNGSALAPVSTTIHSATIKNGFHQFIDSIQVVLNSTTIQSSQIFTNIDANYKILTEFDYNQYVKHGATLGLGLDDFNSAQDSNQATTDSLDNAGLVTSVGGFDAWTTKNSGIKERLLHFNNNANTSSLTLGKSILGNNQIVVGKSNVRSDATVATAGSDVFVFYALGTVKLAQLSDAIKNLPLMKGVRGFIYLNYNSSTHALTNTTGASAITGVVNQSVYGRCAPASFNIGSDGFLANAVTGSTVTFSADINGTSSSLPDAKPIQTNAMLYAPYYIATPEVDRSLSFTKKIRYNERFVTSFSITENSNFNGTLSPGISNPKRVILYPYFTGAGTSTNSAFITNPLLSALDSAPSTTSPFATLKDLQLYVGNVPMFQQPVSMDWFTFLSEVSENGIDGGKNDQQASGLLSQRLWNQAYKYYTVNVGRRLNSEDGASKAVQISCSNATNCPMTVVAIIWYEREITVNTASGQVMQGM